MTANQVMTRYPDIQFVVPHNGSFLPYMASRFSGVPGILASLGMMDLVDVIAELSKLYFNIAGDPDPVQLDMLRIIGDDSHIVYGSDFPHSSAKVIINKKKHLDGNEKYNRIREKIYADNAKHLLEC